MSESSFAISIYLSADHCVSGQVRANQIEATVGWHAYALSKLNANMRSHMRAKKFSRLRSTCVCVCVMAFSLPLAQSILRR